MILLLLLMLFSEVTAMDNPSPIIRRGDHISFRVLSVDEGDEQKGPIVAPELEVFDSFFCTDEQVSSYDDVHKLARVRISLFMHLCVQASKATGSRAQQFQELLEKIKKKDYITFDVGKSEIYNNLAVTDAQSKVQMHNNVSVSEERVGITVKDLCYRLLSCIPKGCTNCMINGKKVRLDMAYYETEDDKIANQKKQEEMDKLPPQKWEWGKGMECRIARKEYFLSTASVAYNRCKLGALRCVAACIKGRLIEETHVRAYLIPEIDTFIKISDKNIQHLKFINFPTLQIVYYIR